MALSRRDALKALTALPAVTSIQVARLEPNDVIVVECEHHLSHEVVFRIHDSAQRVWPDRKVLVLDKGLHLKVVRG